MPKEVDIDKLIDFELSFWHDKNLKRAQTLYDKIFAKDLVTHSPLGISHGQLSVYETYLTWLKAFPNIILHQKDFRQVRNVVFWDWDSTAKHEHVFQNILPTGKEIYFRGRTIYMFKNGKISNYMCCVNMLEVYQQLGCSLRVNT